MSAHIEIVGYVGKDAEVVAGRDGKSYVKFNVASYDSRTKESTWYRVTAFNRDAKFAGYVLKGKHVLVRGSLEAKLRENDGKTFLNLDVILGSLEFLDRKSEGDGESSQGDRKPAPRPRTPSPDPMADDEMDDDIPF